MKKDVGLVGMILALLAAVIWTANCIVLLLYAGEATPVRVILIVDVVCAIIWWIVFMVAVQVRRKNRNQAEHEPQKRK